MHPIKTFKDTWYSEITQAHVTKWSGLSFLANLANVSAHSICAVGDELNDLTMIQQAGIGVAMGNARLELQKQADWICGNHDNDGLLKVIDFIRDHNDDVQ
jgi:hydroxymethylpyrimidine pyrophosphatase-like HAD family hydrolase